jgi:circadian clock protein KaiC
MDISTIADTWIHLAYRVLGGERNRTLSIVKSRGTAHSNQVRELILTKNGIDLADVYTAGGEVLVGTARFEKEAENRIRHQRRRLEQQLKRAQLGATQAELTARIDALQKQLAAKHTEIELLETDVVLSADSETDYDNRIRRLRSADGSARPQ